MSLATTLVQLYSHWLLYTWQKCCEKRRVYLLARNSEQVPIWLSLCQCYILHNVLYFLLGIYHSYLTELQICPLVNSYCNAKDKNTDNKAISRAGTLRSSLNSSPRWASHTKWSWILSALNQSLCIQVLRWTISNSLIQNKHL